jgi:DNA-directed RNA polymerase specialized sigma24 family protein
MNALADLVVAAQSGNVEAYGRLVQATQTMAYAVALSVLKDSTAAQDAVQQAYLRAFRRLGDLQEPATFAGWLRRIVITSALNMRRARRWTLLSLDDVPDVPVLDEAETRWSEAQRHRLAANAGVDDGAMRKRLQRIRDKLRKEMEVAEQRAIRPDEIRADLPAKVVELLARPKLTDLPENPVGKMLDLLHSAYPEFAEQSIPEVVDLAEAKKTIASEAMYIDPVELHRVDEHRILRYDLTLPLLLTVRYEGKPLQIWTAGKCYRLCQQDAMHLEAFHQAEVLWVDERSRLDPWQMTGRVLRSVNRALPGRTVKIVPTQYAMCSQAWELEVDDEGRWSEVLAWGVYSDRIVRHLGGDPERHVAVGVGYGLERIAMLRYGIDDARKIDVASVA